jgi:quercetin dioxygenase-like cupin family protein
MNEVPLFLLRQNTDGPCIGVVGDLYRFLAVGEETDGKYAFWEAVVPPGGGPPPHRHSREVEFFQVLEGEITFVVDGKSIAAGPGSFVHMPIGVVHSFKNAGPTRARMLIGVAPAGLEGMFFEVGVPMEDPDAEPPKPSQEDIDKLLSVAPRYGVEILVPDHD